MFLYWSRLFDAFCTRKSKCNTTKSREYQSHQLLRTPNTHSSCNCDGHLCTIFKISCHFEYFRWIYDCYIHCSSHDTKKIAQSILRKICRYTQAYLFSSHLTHIRLHWGIFNIYRTVKIFWNTKKISILH